MAEEHCRFVEAGLGGEYCHYLKVIWLMDVDELVYDQHKGQTGVSRLILLAHKVS